MSSVRIIMPAVYKCVAWDDKHPQMPQRSGTEHKRERQGALFVSSVLCPNLSRSLQLWMRINWPPCKFHFNPIPQNEVIHLKAYFGEAKSFTDTSNSGWLRRNTIIFNSPCQKLSQGSLYPTSHSRHCTASLTSRSSMRFHV